MAPTIAILGTSGYVGKATVQELSKRGVAATAFVRDPNNEKSNDLKLPHITLQAGDMGNEENTTTLLKGFDVVFIITPGHHERTAIAQAAVRASKAAGVKHIVVVSVLSADHQAHLFGRQFQPIEQTTKDTGLPYTILRLPLFVDNNFAHVGSIKAQGHIYGPQIADAPYVAISVHDIALASATILADPSNHVNKTYSLVSSPYTNADVAAAFSAALGKEVQYIQVDYAAAKQAFMGLGFPEWQTDGVLELFKSIDAKEPLMSTTNDDFKSITGSEPLTIAKWVELVAPAFK